MPPKRKPTSKQQNEDLEKKKMELIKEIVDLQHQLGSTRLEAVRENPLEDIKRSIDRMHEETAVLSATINTHLIPQWQSQEGTKRLLHSNVEKQRGTRLALELDIEKQRHIGLCLCEWTNSDGESRVHSLPCGHLYCTDCITEQMNRGAFTCKQCKRQFERHQVWRVFYGES